MFLDIKKSKLNVSVAIFFRFFMLVGSILVRRYLIQYIGNEVNGLDSLYVSLIGFLSVAELGVGSAITFCMYKPIVEGDEKKVAALYQLFVKSYLVIGATMLTIGAALIPFLPWLAKDYITLDVKLGSTFFLMLFSIVLSYVFSAKTSLINAYKNNYVTTTISSVGMIVQYVLQIIAIITTHSFVAYLICRIIAMLLQWFMTELYSRKHHKDILCHCREYVDNETKTEILSKVKALFMHQIGTILVNSADGMIISAFIGVVVLGKYSNYSSIAVSMTSVIALFFTPLTSIVGHLFVSEKDKTENAFEKLYFLNFVLGIVFFLGYYAIIDNLVEILFGQNLQLAKSVSWIITLNYFVQFMRQGAILFRNATGTFYNDRWKPLPEGILNVILSISFVRAFSKIGGDELGMVGVIIATIITNLTICHIVEPYVLYKHAFGKSVKKHLLKNYCYIAVFIAALMGMDVLIQSNVNPWIELIINGFISMGVSAAALVVVVAFDKDIRTDVSKLFNRRDCN